eukprot:TRINITY_DN8530_c0_g2_i1.p2 TRINITY_DN8530_c0_g2~~TRINITY_DN8530_c0_g2_i1.p2  ORF type:complete len:194 (+),score=53.56 TRINITY_DN8530_c0_g2_i1:90-584(+)
MANQWDAVRHCPSYSDALPAIADIVAQVINDNAAAAAADAQPAATVFDLPTSSGPIGAFILRLVGRINCTPATWINAFILVDRFAKRKPLRSQNAHLVVAAAFMTALMISNDYLAKLRDYARLLGLSARCLKRLMLHFLSVIEFDIALPAALYHEVDGALRGTG